MVCISLLASCTDNKDMDDLHLVLLRLLQGFTVSTGYVAKYPMWPAKYKKLWEKTPFVLPDSELFMHLSEFSDQDIMYNECTGVALEKEYN